MRLRSNRLGFTLLELSCVLGILALCIGLSMHTITVRPYKSIRTDIDYLVAVLHALYAKALIEGKEQSLVCGDNFYTSRYGKKSLSSGVIFGVKPGIKGPPSEPIAPITKAITFPNNTFMAYPDGTTNAGAFYLTATNPGSMTYAVTCGVSPLFYVRVYCYNHTWQLMR